MDVQQDNAIKLLVLGENSVGKSSLVRNFVRCKIDEFEAIGDLFKKSIMIRDHKYMLQLWDSGSDDQCNSLPPQFFRNAMGALLVYDIGRKETFDKLNGWMRYLKIYCDEAELPIVVVGNKVDLKREVSRVDGFMFARQHRAMFIETSAKLDNNFKEVVWDMVQQCAHLKQLVIRKPDIEASSPRVYAKAFVDIPIYGQAGFEYYEDPNQFYAKGNLEVAAGVRGGLEYYQKN